jgi:hypothetical protein
MNQMSADQGQEGEAEGGPMWGRFFESLGHDDTESVMSGSNLPTDRHRSTVSRSVSHVMQSPYSEVHPNDSASVISDDRDDGSALGGKGRKKGALPSITGALSAVAFDGTYVFKFRTPSGRTHRFQARHDDMDHLRDIVAGKLATDPYFTQHKAMEGSEAPDPTDFLLTYIDKDGDTIIITTDGDVVDAVQTARDGHEDRVVLYVQGGKGWEDVTAEKSAKQAEQIAAAAQEEVKAIEKIESIAASAPAVATPGALPEYAAFAPPAPVHVPREDDKVLGIPKDMLLPASIGALAAVILGVFTISRLSR